MKSVNQTGYRTDIDGLRAVAVALVLAFHAFPDAVPGGFAGVDVFFVISGFLITRLILAPDFAIVDFYQKRARRLFPALAIVLLSSLAAGWYLQTPSQFADLGPQFADLGRQALAASLFLPNILFWSQTGYFDAAAVTKPLLHLWSLGVEEQFYLVWPFLLLLTAHFRFRVRWLLVWIFVLSLLSGFYGDHVDPTGASSFYLPLPRAWELVAGSYLAVSRTLFCPRSICLSNVATLAGLSAIVLGAIFSGKGTSWPNLATVSSVGGAVSIIHCGTSSPVSKWLLSNRLATALGKISYPLYLWHWPVLTFFYLRTGAALSPLAACAALLVSLCLALLTYSALETPIRRSVSLRLAVPTLASALAVAGFVGLGIELKDGMPSRLPTTLQEALNYERYDFKTGAFLADCWLENESTVQRLPTSCIRTDAVDSILIVVDSHAVFLSTGLRAVFGADRVTQLTRSSCPPLPEYGSEACHDINRAAVKIIEHRPPKTVVLFAAWQNYPGGWQHGSANLAMLGNMIEAIRRAGASNILVVGPAPRFDPTLPSLLMQDWLKRHWSVIPDRIDNGRQETKAISQNIGNLASASNVRFLSLLDLLCTEHGCLTKVPGTRSSLVTWDYGHLTKEAAKLVAEIIRDGMGPEK